MNLHHFRIGDLVSLIPDLKINLRDKPFCRHIGQTATVIDLDRKYLWAQFEDGKYSGISFHYRWQPANKREPDWRA